MRRARILILALLFSILAGGAVFADAIKLTECGLEGDAKRPVEKALNPFKNRVAVPTGDQIDPFITIENFLEPGDDRARFSPTQAASITGWVAVVKPGGLESCNCHDPKLLDTHIALVADPKDYGHAKKYVIAEITPRFRALMAKLGTDWSTATLKKTILHKRVRVTGWLFFDAMHTNAAENTHPRGAHNWRATAWEVAHPVTALEVLDAPDEEDSTGGE